MTALFNRRSLFLGVTTLILLGLFFFPKLTSAQGTAVFRTGDILTGGDRSFPNCDWCDPVNAGPGHAIEFRMMLQNMAEGTVAKNVKVTANLPSTPTNSPLTASATGTADNASAVSDTLTVNFSGSQPQAFAYIPGHARVFSKSCPNGCAAPDTVISSGIPVEDLAFGESAQVLWKAFITNNQPSPTLTPTPHPTATPTVAPTATPTVAPTATPTSAPTATPTATGAPTATPTASPGNINLQCPNGTTFQRIEGNNIICIQNVQNQTNNQTQTNNNNQTVNVTVPSGAPGEVKVLSATTQGVSELPKTGLPLAGLALAGLAPVGMRLRKAGKEKLEGLTPKFIWEEREFKKED